MKANTLLLALAATLAGCVTPAPPITNLNGQPIKFSAPILTKSDLPGAKFVLLEKSIANGQYTVVNISATRQPIANPRQERIAFNARLTAFAPDYEDTGFHTFTDSGNYGQQTVVLTCGPSVPKTRFYSACDSAFADVFIPMGLTKSYAAGRMSTETMKQLEDPARNHTRYVGSPEFALKQAGVFQRLGELAAAK